MITDNDKIIDVLGYVIPVPNNKEKSIIKTLKAGYTSFFELEKNKRKLSISAHPTSSLQKGDFVVVHTDKTCNLHQVYDIKHNVACRREGVTIITDAVQFANKHGGPGGFAFYHHIYGKVVSAE